MTGGFPIGRVFGIQLKLDWSWIFIFLLATWKLASAFGSWHPDWVLLAWALAVVAAILLFASLLAYSLVAGARRLPLRKITLFLFGSLSNRQKVPPRLAPSSSSASSGRSPAPITSIGIAVLFILFFRLSTPPGELVLQDVNTLVGSLDPLNTHSSGSAPSTSSSASCAGATYSSGCDFTPEERCRHHPPRSKQKVSDTQRIVTIRDREKGI